MIDIEIANLEGLNPKNVNGECYITSTHRGYTVNPYSPSTNWAQGGPLIDKYQVSIFPCAYGGWEARICDTFSSGKSPLIAAMSAILVAHSGGGNG